MQELLDLIRRRPLLAAFLLAIGVALAIATVLLNDSDGLLLPTLFILICGIFIGGVIAWLGRERPR